jgi:alpha-amylase
MTLDYFDFGNYNKMVLQKLVSVHKTESGELNFKAHSENIQVYADIVLNHNSGGQLETTHTGTQTYTDFTGVASGKFQEQAPIL